MTDGPLPSSSHAPSTWYAEVEAPHRNPGGNGVSWRGCTRSASRSSSGGSGLVQRGAVGGDDPLVPAQALLARAREGAVALVVLVDVDEAVALGHLRGGEADDVQAAPGGVAEQLDAVGDGLAGLPQVLAVVGDPVVVVHGAVRGDGVDRAEAV